METILIHTFITFYRFFFSLSCYWHKIHSTRFQRDILQTYGTCIYASSSTLYMKSHNISSHSSILLSVYVLGFLFTCCRFNNSDNVCVFVCVCVCAYSFFFFKLINIKLSNESKTRNVTAIAIHQTKQTNTSSVNNNWLYIVTFIVCLHVFAFYGRCQTNNNGKLVQKSF